MDSVGKATWDGSLDSLKPLGVMITFGNASGKPDPVDPQVLAGKGSLFLTRPTLFTHIASREACQARADELFEMVTSGKVQIRINQTYPLAEVAQAHRDLEARKTTGTTIPQSCYRDVMGSGWCGPPDPPATRYLSLTGRQPRTRFHASV
jgi:NADPH2:quinone reductase